MAELTKDLEKVLKDASMDGSACWKHKQSGKWIVYHWACERLAAHYGIHFDPPEFIENEAASSVAILVVGHINTPMDGNEHRQDWSVGEASPQNNKNPYPYAMAEKRAKDRVILKLLNLHGIAYSEEEADDLKREAIPGGVHPNDISGADKLKTSKSVKVTELKERARKMSDDLGCASDEGELNGILTAYATLMNDLKNHLPDWHQAALDKVESVRQSFNDPLGGL